MHIFIVQHFDMDFRSMCHIKMDNIIISIYYLLILVLGILSIPLGQT